jgi:hypothetical protein
MGGSSQPVGAFGSPSVLTPQPDAFAGLGLGGMGSPITQPPRQATIVSPVQTQKAEDDLLGLF